MNYHFPILFYFVKDNSYQLLNSAVFGNQFIKSSLINTRF